MDNTILNLIFVPTVYLLLAIVAFSGNIYKKLQSLDEAETYAVLPIDRRGVGTKG